METIELIKGKRYNYQLKNKTVEVEYLYQTLNYRIFSGTEKGELYQLSEPVVQNFITEE